ncbi:MAG: Uncharacterised protein [Hyphomonas sp. TMED17]|nr:MAG: Uncharacterised protein [Hyphomonas sp. TMED17]
MCEVPSPWIRPCRGHLDQQSGQFRRNERQGREVFIRQLGHDDHRSKRGLSPCLVNNRFLSFRRQIDISRHLFQNRTDITSLFANDINPTSPPVRGQRPAKPVENATTPGRRQFEFYTILSGRKFITFPIENLKLKQSRYQTRKHSGTDTTRHQRTAGKHGINRS